MNNLKEGVRWGVAIVITSWLLVVVAPVAVIVGTYAALRWVKDCMNDW